MSLFGPVSETGCSSTIYPLPTCDSLFESPLIACRNSGMYVGEVERQKVVALRRTVSFGGAACQCA